jgi:hypothetical protein
MVLLFVGNAAAFTAKIVNDTDQIMKYAFIWNECDWKDFPANTTMAAGQIEPGKTTNLERGYKGGKWTMEWTGPKGGFTRHIMDVPDKGILILKVDMPEFFRGT